jgi:Major Facilitator Superfamily
LITLVDSIGLGLYTTGAVVFFVRSLHLRAEFVGTGLTVAAAVGLAASLPAGRLADRRDARQILVVLCAVQAALFAVFPFVQGRIEFLTVVTAVAFAESAARPVRRVLLSDLVSGGPRVVAAAYNRSVLNVGVSLGALLAAGALALDSRPAYDALLLGNAASFVGAGLLLARLRVDGRSRRPSPSSPPIGKASAARHPLGQPRFVAAALSCGILYLSASVLDVGLPLQVSERTNAPRWMIAALLLLNTAMAVTLQVRASAGSETISGAARANRLAGIALLGACVLFPVASHGSAVVAAAVLIAATVLLTAGELFSSAGSWGLSYGLAPLGHEGQYLASFGLASQAVQVAGPALAAAVVTAGLDAWLALGVVYLGAGLATPLITRRPLRPVSVSGGPGHPTR